MPASFGPRSTWVFCFAVSVLAGCEDDSLGPVAAYKPQDCIDVRTCSEGGIRLDAGFVSTDSGVHPDSGASDSGAGLDAGLVDSGAPGLPDSGADAGEWPDASPPPTPFLNLAGSWRTHYVFDLSSYLFGVSGIAQELDFIDQTFQGNIDTGFPPLDAFIVSIVQQYVPPWLVRVVDILNTLANLFEEMEAFGTMNISQDPPATPTALVSSLHANESWSHMVVHLIDQCPMGQQDPNYPQCAEHIIPVTNSPTPVAGVDVTVNVKPFDGELQGGVPSADFVFRNREVELEMRRLILLVIDNAIFLATNGQYPDLRGALGAAVNCVGLGAGARNFAQNTLGLSAIVAAGLEALVIDQCNDILDGLVNGIANIGVDWDALQFDQLGHAVDLTPADGLNRPERLQELSVPDTIDGRFRFALSSSLGGRWEGGP